MRLHVGGDGVRGASEGTFRGRFGRREEAFGGFRAHVEFALSSMKRPKHTHGLGTLLGRKHLV
jgi:hypothetical protein